MKKTKVFSAKEARKLIQKINRDDKKQRESVDFILEKIQYVIRTRQIHQVRTEINLVQLKKLRKIGYNVIIENKGFSPDNVVVKITWGNI